MGDGPNRSRISSTSSSKSSAQNKSKKKIGKNCVGNYILGKTIGQGTFGKVKIGLHLITGEKVAIKILEKSKIVEPADVERVRREIQILKRNRHRNIIQLYEVLDTDTTIYLIMEHADGGEMFDYIVANQRIREEEAVRMFHQVVDGLDYLHKMEVTHRDLKPENLLLQSSQDGWIIKIVDFGLSNTHDGGRLLQTACGSPCYAAPEMIAGKKYVGPLADIWSLGVILFAMVCGFLPFEDSNTNMLYRKILNAQYKIPGHVSLPLRDLIKRILNTNPEERYHVQNIRAHPWHMACDLPIPLPLDGEECEVNEAVLARIQSFGIDPVEAIRDIKKRLHNTTTTSYYLMLNKYNRTVALVTRKDAAALPRKSTIKAQEKKQQPKATTNVAIKAIKPEAVKASQKATEKPVKVTKPVQKVQAPTAAKVQVPRLPLHTLDTTTVTALVSKLDVKSTDTTTSSASRPAQPSSKNRRTSSGRKHQAEMKLAKEKASTTGGSVTARVASSKKKVVLDKTAPKTSRVADNSVVRAGLSQGKPPIANRKLIITTTPPRKVWGSGPTDIDQKSKKPFAPKKPNTSRTASSSSRTKSSRESATSSSNKVKDKRYVSTFKSPKKNR